MNSINNVAHNMVAELTHNLNSMLANNATTSRSDNRSKKQVGSAIDFNRFNVNEQLDTLSIASSRRSKKNKDEKYKFKEESNIDIGDDGLKCRTKQLKKLLPNSFTADNQKTKAIRNRDVPKKVSKLRKSSSNQSLNKKKPPRQQNKLKVAKINPPKVIPREAKSSERSYAVSRVQFLNSVGDSRQYEEDEEQEVRNVNFEEDKVVENKSVEPETNHKYYRENESESHAVGLVDYYSHNYLKPTMAYHLKCVQHNYWRHYSDGRLPFVVGTSVSATNNVRLLRQQTASKIKTFCRYNVSCDQLSDFKVYKLRSLIRDIEKIGRKLFGTSAKSNSNNEEMIEDSTQPNNSLAIKEN